MSRARPSIVSSGRVKRGMAALPEIFTRRSAGGACAPKLLPIGETVGEGRLLSLTRRQARCRALWGSRRGLVRAARKGAGGSDERAVLRADDGAAKAAQAEAKGSMAAARA